MSAQKVSLTNEVDCIYVDDVDVSKGVIAKTANSISYIILGYHKKLKVANATLTDWNSDYETLRAVMESRRSSEFYTLSNLRITTEKQLNVGDLKWDSIIAWRHESGRIGYCAHIEDLYYMVAPNKTPYYQSGFKSINLLVADIYQLGELLIFDTYQELHETIAEWLSE